MGSAIYNDHFDPLLHEAQFEDDGNEFDCFNSFGQTLPSIALLGVTGDMSGTPINELALPAVLTGQPTRAIRESGLRNIMNRRTNFPSSKQKTAGMKHPYNGLAGPSSPGDAHHAGKRSRTGFQSKSPYERTPSLVMEGSSKSHAPGPPNLAFQDSVRADSGSVQTHSLQRVPLPHSPGSLSDDSSELSHVLSEDSDEDFRESEGESEKAPPQKVDPKGKKRHEVIGSRRARRLQAEASVMPQFQETQTSADLINEKGEAVKVEICGRVRVKAPFGDDDKFSDAFVVYKRNYLSIEDVSYKLRSAKLEPLFVESLLIKSDGADKGEPLINLSMRLKAFRFGDGCIDRDIALQEHTKQRIKKDAKAPRNRHLDPFWCSSWSCERDLANLDEEWGPAQEDREEGMRHVSNITLWERVQFKDSTKNNGPRRPYCQDFFRLALQLVARLPTRETVVLAETLSDRFIVRGRSPRNFEPGAREKRRASAKGKKAVTSSGLGPAFPVADAELDPDRHAGHKRRCSNCQHDVEDGQEDAEQSADIDPGDAPQKKRGRRPFDL